MTEPSQDAPPAFAPAAISDLTAFQVAVELSNDAHALLDPAGRLLWANRSMAERLGYRREELAGLGVADLDPLFPAGRYAALFARARAERLPPFETVHRRKDGSTFPVEVSVTVVATPEGERMLAAARDISDRKAAEAERERLLAAEREARAEAEAVGRRLEAVLSSVGDAFFSLDREWRLTYLNTQAERLIGQPRESVLGRRLLEVFPAAEGSPFLAAYARTMATGETTSVEAQFAPLHLWLAVRAYAAPDGITVYVRDVTERRHTMAALAEREARHRVLLESIDVGFSIVELVPGPPADFRFLEANPAFARLTTLPDVAGRRASELLPADEVARWADVYERVVVTGAPLRLETRAATDRWLDVFVARVGGREDGRAAVVFTDVSAARAADAERDRVLTAERVARAEAEVAAERLRRSETRYALAARATSNVIWDWDPATGTLAWSEGVQGVFGYAPDLVRGDIDWWHERIHPDDLARVATGIRAVVDGADGGREWRDAYRFRRADGSWADVVDRGYVERDAAGRAVRMIGAMEDVTAQRQLEARLRQAQKMEAVGQLAGGVAHDFNNLLTVIAASLEFVREDLEPGHRVRPDLDEIARAAERARTLVRQLLTFSRKQSVRPARVLLRELLLNAERMLQRVLGAEIMLEVHGGGAVVAADPGQLEQVLVNLAVNARDAMLDPRHGHPGTGGTLTIEADEVVLTAAEAAAWSAADGGGAAIAPGRWARLVVRDTGHGMDAATRARVFEPFFTTKAVGQGTGLGLAMVYGIVQQAGGAVHVESEPGAGTTVTILLPAVDAEAPARAAAVEATPAPVRGATVLLVEDEAAVRASARRLLERRGHVVIEAKHATDALLVWRMHREVVDVVVTDIRMPGMTGRELVAALTVDQPGLPVVYMSGYSGREMSAALGPREAFVEKPFTSEVLLAAVEKVLRGAEDGAEAR